MPKTERSQLPPVEKTIKRLQALHPFGVGADRQKPPTIIYAESDSNVAPYQVQETN